MFGRPAYLFPVMLAYAGWLVQKNQALPEVRSRASSLLRSAGFVLTLFTSCGLATLHWNGAGFPDTAGGGWARWSARAAPGPELAGCAAAPVRLWLAGVALFLGASWFEIMDKRRRRSRGSIGRARARAKARARLRPGRASRPARSGARGAKEGGEPAAAAHRGCGARPGKKRAGRARAPGAAVRGPQVERAAGAVAAGRAGAARAVLFGRGARGHVASRRAQAPRFRRRGRGRRRPAGPRDHPLRAASGARREGEPDQQSRERSGARAIRHQRSRGRDHSRQIGRRSRDPEREARDRHARRDHQVQALRRSGLAARARPRQGHRRAGGRRSRAHAASA